MLAAIDTKALGWIDPEHEIVHLVVPVRFQREIGPQGDMDPRALAGLDDRGNDHGFGDDERFLVTEDAPVGIG